MEFTLGDYRIRSASAALTSALACSAPRTESEEMVARANSGVTSAAMLMRPSTCRSSVWPCSAHRFQIGARVVPQTEIERVARDALLDDVGVPLELVADGGADEIGAVRIEPLVHH